MGGKAPGPLCGWSQGTDWIDQGTLALTRSDCPGPIGTEPPSLLQASPMVDAPDPSVLEQLRQQFVIGAVLGIRKALCTVNPMGGQQQVFQDEVQAMQLLAQGQYEQAFEAATGLQDYFKIYHQSKATDATKGQTGVAMVGHLTGFNQVTAAATGEDIKGQGIGTGERILTGLDGLLRIANTAITVGGLTGAGVAKLRSFGPVRVVSPVYRIAGRDVLIVETSAGRQAFYRSSGVNSNMPGEWLPVDEFRLADGWFNKTSYVHGPGRELGEPLHRYGTEEFRRVSQQLGQMQIPTGQQAPMGQLDRSAEATMNHILDFFGARRTPTLQNRPMPDPTVRQR